MFSIHDDRGTTLTELLVAIMLLTIVSLVFLPTLVAGLNATKDLQGAVQANDEARLALQRLDREFRAADRICAPLPGGSNAGDFLDFRTRAYTSATTADGTRRLAYQLNGTDLEKSSDGGTTWTPVVHGIVNATHLDDDYNLNHADPVRPAGTIGIPIFTTEGGGAGSYPSFGKVVTVRLWIDINPNDRIGARLVTTELSGRNVWTPLAPGC
jgi:type II secretory pathway pseudopilin PulG